MLWIQTCLFTILDHVRTSELLFKSVFLFLYLNHFMCISPEQIKSLLGAAQPQLWSNIWFQIRGMELCTL